MSSPGLRGSARVRVAALGLVLAVFAVSCGSDDGGSAAEQVESAREGGAAEVQPESGAGEADAAVEVVMTDVATGAETTLDAALAGSGDKPLLAWFWAPFCSTCRREAPELNEFMAENSDRVEMVGIGSRDDLAFAEDFLGDTGVSNFPLLWEPTGQSWVDNAVAAQPYMILLVDGEEVQRWPGGASVRQLEDALAEL